MRSSPPSQSPRSTSRSSGTTTGSERQRGERGSGLRRALERRDEKTGQFLVGEPIRYGLRLLLALRGKRRIAVAAHQGERLPGTAGAEAPCRTSTTSVAPSGRANERW